ncbi:hypothetical protein CEE37_03035 [candidate division LCP-89 bacterium B3_LCP]|uniref:Right handed beta helix domain-containing protein n=1 Tax=candidate division LCP-89 bacterium B3_LCP TaxID=2012998 RepID=A0A532V2W1_UNCL8|nr:MAG: hypothetical protein CEE37_03035 [candidate division LCP-89 bacterium B3_LCP]
MKKMMAALAALIMISGTVQAADWYVDWNSGSNGANGSQANPWQTLNYALNQGSIVEPGDTIWLRGGTYIEDVVLDWGDVVNGTTDNLVTIRAYEEDTTIEEVTLQGKIRVYSNAGGQAYGINHRYMNFRITGSGADAYRLSGDNPDVVTEFINMEMDSCQASGIYMGYGSNNFGILRVLGCDIHHNPPGNINGSGDGNSGIILSAKGHIEIEDCAIHNNGDRQFASFENKGINIQNQPGYTGHLKRSYIYENVETGIDCPIEYGLIEDCVFYYNGIMDTVEVGWGEENGDSNISLQSSGHDIIIRRCLIYNSGRYGICSMCDDNVIYNCTIVDTIPYEKQYYQADRGPLYFDSAAEGNVAKNNIIVNLIPYTEGDDPDLFIAMLASDDEMGNSYTGNTIDHNLYYTPYHPDGKIVKIAGGGTFNLPELQSAWPSTNNDDNSLSEMPHFTDRFNNIYSLTELSPAIDSGTTAITGSIFIPPDEYSGDAPDMGYWELTDPGGAPAPSEPPWLEPPIGQ